MFFNEAEAVAGEETGESETAARQQKEKTGKRKRIFPVFRGLQCRTFLSEEELEERFRKRQVQTTSG